MKKLLFLVCLFPLCIFGQTSPTLGVGLEQLTMNKGTIDVEVLTEIIMEKQKELKKEALERFMFKLFPQGNYATKFYIQNCLHTLLNEKNPQVIEKEILEFTTNYAVALGIAAIYDNEFQRFKQQDSTTFQAKMIDAATVSIMKSVNKKIENARLNRDLKDSIFQKLDFRLLVDVVSLALSESQKIKNQGFYKYPIDYTEGEQYREFSKDPSLSEDLKKLKDKIKVQVDAYVDHYEVIKEFYSRRIGANNSEIKDLLLQIYTDEILNINSDNRIAKMLGKVKTAAGNKINIAINNYTSTRNQLSQAQQKLATLENKTRVVEQYTAILERKKTIAQLEDTLKISLRQPSVPIKDSLLVMVGRVETNDRDKLIQEVNKYLDAKKIQLIEIEDFEKIKSEYKGITLKNSLGAALKSVEPKKRISASDLENLKASEVATEDIAVLKVQIDALTAKLISDAREMVKDQGFIKLFLNELVTNLYSSSELSLNLNVENEAQLSLVKSYGETLSHVYKTLNNLAKKDVYDLADIRYIEDTLLPELVQYSVVIKDSAQRVNFTASIQNFKLLANMLKISAVQEAHGAVGNVYDPRLINILTFVSNLDKLDEAATYQSIINLVRDNNLNVVNCLPAGNFKDTYLLFVNGIKKYVLINPVDEYVQVDVISFLNDLQQFYLRRDQSRFGLYLTLGLSQNFFTQDVQLQGSTEYVDNVGFASEKIGLQYTIIPFGRESLFPNAIKNDIYLTKQNPFINEWYAIVYGSGLLYSLANTATNENFDYPHVGIGTGVRFYNALDFNVSLGLPFINGETFGNNAFLSVGLDIPLGEYLEKLNSK